MCAGNMKGTGMEENSNARAAQWRQDGFDPDNCPVRTTLDHVAAKWTTLILMELQAEPRRFNALGRALPDISKRMLTQSLRNLERDGMLKREVFPSKPPSVEYSLTDLGHSFMEPLDQLIHWAMARHGDIAAARTRFDNNQ